MAQRINGALRFPRCAGPGGFERSALLNDSNNFRHLVGTAGLYGFANGRPILFIPTLHGNNQRQGRLPLAQIVAQIFTHFKGIAVVIQNVIDHLKRCTQRPPVVGTSRLNRRRRSRE